LRPGGVFIGSEPANDHWLTRAIRHWQYRHSRFQGRDPEEDGFSRYELATAGGNGLGWRIYQQFSFIAYPLGNTDILPLLTRLSIALLVAASDECGSLRSGCH
jgi:hypothetical protein